MYNKDFDKKTMKRKISASVVFAHLCKLVILCYFEVIALLQGAKPQRKW